MDKTRTYLMLCGGTGCHSSGTKAFREALENELKRWKLTEEIKVVETGCNGFCAVGPVMLAQPEGIFYQRLKAEDAAELVESHFLKGMPVQRLMYKEPKTKKIIPLMSEIPFFSNQFFVDWHNKFLPKIFYP